MNSQYEQHVNIKFCIRLCKLTIETLKLLKEVYEPEFKAELTIHKWHFKPGTHQRTTGEPNSSRTVCASCTVNSFSTNLRRAKDIRCVQFSLILFMYAQKNRQLLVRDKQCANHSQMAQRRFAVPSTHTRIWFANHLAH